MAPSRLDLPVVAWLRRSGGALVLAGVIAACGQAGSPTTAAPTVGSTAAAPSSTTTPRATAPQPDLSGKFDVGGHSLYLECYGTEGPVIVFDAGSGGWSFLWKSPPKFFVQLVDSGYRRCLYDRTNLGASDDVPGYRTSETAARELHALLVSADLPGPYVVVGRSFGGYNVRLFAATYPEDTKALILVETLTPEFHTAMEGLLTAEQWADEVEGLQGAEIPMDIIGSTPLVAAAKLPDVPLLVVTGTKWHSGNQPWPYGWPAAELDALWDDAQRNLGASVPRGRTVVFEGGDHALQISQPERLAREINEFLAAL